MLSNHLKSTTGIERPTVGLFCCKWWKPWKHTQRRKQQRGKKKSQEQQLSCSFLGCQNTIAEKRKKKEKSIATFTATSNSLLPLPFCTGVQPPHRETSVREVKWMQPEGTPPLVFVCLLEDYSWTKVRVLETRLRFPRFCLAQNQAQIKSRTDLMVMTHSIFRELMLVFSCLLKASLTSSRICIIPPKWLRS